jgi:hypothetical protein
LPVGRPRERDANRSAYEMEVMSRARSSDWWPHALCRSYPMTENSKLWSPAEKNEVPKRAKEICDSCPVSAQCLSYALELERGLSVKNRFNIFGGKTPFQRARLDSYVPDEPDNRVPRRVTKVDMQECPCGCGKQFNVWSTYAGTGRSSKRQYATPECRDIHRESLESLVIH